LNVADDREYFGSKLVSLGRHNLTTDCRTFAGIGGVEPSRHKKENTLPYRSLIKSCNPADARTSFSSAVRTAAAHEGSFGNAFRNACNAAGVRKSAHGVRKTGATRAATDGTTVAELEAIFGWQGEWLHSTPARPIEHAWLRQPWRSWIERPINTLFPHHLERCGSQSEKINYFSRLEDLQWCGREDSNLHGSPH
jgi:hypothetical protein